MPDNEAFELEQDAMVLERAEELSKDPARLGRIRKHLEEKIEKTNATVEKLKGKSMGMNNSVKRHQ